MADSLTIRCGGCGKTAEVPIPPGAFEDPCVVIYAPPGWYLTALDGPACSRACFDRVLAAKMYAWENADAG